MKLVVKKHTGTVLHVVLRPNATLLLLGGLLFVATGLFVIRALAVRAEVSVEGGELRYERYLLGKRSDDSFALPASTVTGIEIVLKEKGINRSYEVAVNASERVYEPYFPMADGDTKREIVEKSLAALSRSDGTYHYEEDGTLPGLILGLSCILGGLYCWFCLQQAVIVADRDAGTLTIRRKRTFTGFLAKGEGDEIPLARVSGVRGTAHTLNTVKHRVTSYQVSVERKGGKPVPVAKGPMFTAASADALKALLETWIAKRER